MKTQFTFWQKVANTPPMWVCLLFALVFSTNCWATVVTAEWGDYTTPATGFPYGTYQEINGIKITPCATLASDPNVYIDGHSWHNYQLNTTGKYFDITLSSGYITQVKCNVWTANNTLLKIQFSKKSPYDSNDLTGDPIPLHDANRDAPTSMLTVNAPSDAKSARIYKDGSDHWQCYLYRLIVTASTGCDSPETATFSASGTGITGSAPSDISACEGGKFTIPDAGSLVKTGYDFVGWNDGSVVKHAGDSYTMPASGISFTAEWEEHYVPAVTDLGSSVSDDDVTLTWTNYNKVDIFPSMVQVPTGASKSSAAAITEWNVSSGILEANYETTEQEHFATIEVALHRDMNHVTSVDFQYIYNSSITSGGVRPYMMYNGEAVNSPWGMYWKGFTSHNATEYTSYTITPDNAGLWGWISTSGDYNAANYIHLVGFMINPKEASTGTYYIKDITINTSDNQTTLDEIKIIRKKGSAPSSISDGTEVYSGVLNTFTDENLEDGTYYYAVYAGDGISYSAAVVEGPIQIGTPKADPELTAGVDKGVISTTGSAQLTVSTDNAYDGTIEYSVSPSGVISLNETTGEITAVAAGTATITVNAPATSGYYSDNKSVTVAVIAAPETNLAITNVDGDNVTLTWDVPGKIDLSTAKTTPSSSFAAAFPSFTYATKCEMNNNEELTVTYSADGNGSITGILIDVNLTSVESLTFDYKSDYSEEAWNGIFPGIYNSSNSTMYWEADSYSLNESTWQHLSVVPSKVFWGDGTVYPSGNISELGFFANKLGGKLSNSHMYIRNVFYHCTGMTDIDHIVIMRTTGAAATDTVSGTKIYSGKMSHFVDTESKAAGLYYYTLFAVYENGSIPVESVTLDTRVFNITYKDKGDAEFSGTHETGYPTTHSNAAATALKKATKEDYIFVGWYDNAACTGDAVTSLAAGAYNADITLYARWEQLSLHQPGKYQAPTSEGGYGRILKNKNGHDYEVYLVTYDAIETTNYGALYAGPVTNISDGYRMFRTTSDINTTTTTKGDGWTEFKPYKYYGSDGSCSIDEFTKLNSSSSIGISHYARLGAGYYVRLYVKGYASFALIGKESEGNSFVVKINGETQTYTANTDEHVARFTLASVDEPYFIEITGNGGNNNNFRGFSLQLPDVEHYTVTVAKNDNSYGTVSAASIATVRAGEATYVSDNTLYIAGTTVTATPAAATAEYTYAFDNWSGVPATITEATTVTANFTRTGNDYTLTWDLNGGTVTTAGTGAEMDATGTPSSSVAYGTAITAPVVEKAGCEFLGWDATPAATMPAENITYTAQWFTPEHISSAGTTTLNHANVRTVVNNTNPHNPIVSFDADNNGEAETCLNLEGPGSATWKAYITRGYYQARVIYGTTSGGVNVKLQVINPATSEIVAETSEDIHTGSEEKHCQAIWGLDLRNVVENQVYEIKVIDMHGAGSLPYVSSVNIVPMSIPDIKSTAVTHLDYTNVTNPNKINVLDVDQDGNAETCMLVDGQKHADWKVTLKNKGKYFVRVMYGKESGGTTLRLHVFDKNGNNVFTHPEDRSLSSSVRYETWTWSNVDLSDCTENEEYIIRIEDRYGSGSKPNIVYLEIKSETVIIPAETRLYAENSISTLNFATDLDIDDDGNNDKLMNLKKNKGNAEWMVKITPGIYNVSLVYGVPAYGVKASVVLIDPSAEDPEDDRFLSTDPYYYHAAVKVGDVQQPHHYTETTLCDLSRITANKTYKVRVQDEWDDDNGCNLRVSHVLFTPIEPLQIPEETRLDASNVNVAPAIDGGRIDISNQKEAVWYAKMTPGIYNIALHYGVTKSNCTKVRFGIVDPATSDTIFRHQEDKCSSDVQTYTIEANNQDLRSSLDAEKVYKIFVKDNYKENGSEPQIDYLEFIRPSVIHTRSGLRVGDYGTICLPYAVASANRTGAELFEIESWAENGTSMTMTQLNENENMIAGRPYIFQATANTATFSYYVDGEEAEAGTHNGLIGSYVEAQIQENDNNYIIYNNKLYLVNAPARVGAYRAYIHRGGEYSPAPANRRRVTMGLYGTQTTTDINQISTEQITNKVIRNGHLFILRGDKIYNAQGQLVQ